MLCKSIALVLIANMHDKSPSQGKTALQISLFFLPKLVMQFILVRYFCNTYGDCGGHGGLLRDRHAGVELEQSL